MVRNGHLWDNSAFETQTSELFNEESYGISDVGYTLAAGGFPGLGNIDADPKFVDVQSADFRLRSESPCIGAGRLNDLPTDLLDLNWNDDTIERVPFDLALSARFRTNGIDLEAFARPAPSESPRPAALSRPAEITSSSFCTLAFLLRRLPFRDS